MLNVHFFHLVQQATFANYQNIYVHCVKQNLE